MMKTILFTNRYSGFPLDIVQSELPDGFEIRFLQEQSQDDLIKEAVNADYLLAGGRLKITREVLEHAEKLQMIQRSGVGLDALDLDAIKELGIPLYVNQGVNAESVAEHTLLLILACLRRLTTIAKNTQSAIWKKQEQGVQTGELKGKTIGIVGMGNIAQTLVGMLKPFHVKILYYNLEQMPKDYETQNNMSFVSLDELLKLSDVVTLHCALTEETKNLICEKTIRMMKSGAVLINTARGEIVNPDALAEALRSGKLSYAALDVHVKEPIPEDYPLRGLDNAILTPHIAGVTSDSFRAMMHDAFRNIECFDRGELEKIESFRYL